MTASGLRHAKLDGARRGDWDNACVNRGTERVFTVAPWEMEGFIVNTPLRPPVHGYPPAEHALSQRVFGIIPEPVCGLFFLSCLLWL